MKTEDIVVVPTTFEGEVLAYEGTRFVIVRIPTPEPRAWRIPIPPDDAHHFDTVPSRSLYDDGTPGAMVSMELRDRQRRDRLQPDDRRSREGQCARRVVAGIEGVTGPLVLSP